MTDLAKRRSLRISLAGLACLGLPSASQAAQDPDLPADPLPAGMQPVSEKDPLVDAMGYRHDAMRVDARYFPTRRLPQNQDQFCANCRLFRPVEGPWGHCVVMIPRGVVYGMGWCGRWTAPPA